jgi:hypothetical protein
MAPDVEDRAVQRLSGLATVDSFDRADSASIGWSENGQAWVPVTAGPIISDGALHYSAGAGPHLVITRILSQHMEIEAELSWATSAGLYLVFRYQNSTNYLMLGLETNGTALRLYKVVSGTATQLGSTVTVAAPSGLFHKVKVTAVGDNIRCYFEDALVLTVADATHNTQEWAGIRMGVGATALTHRVRNFVSRRRAGRFA